MTPRAPHARVSHAREPETGVRLYGVLSAGHGDPAPNHGAGESVRRGAGRRIGTPAGLAAVELLRVRDLVAAVAPAPFVEAAPSAADLEATHTVVATLFAERAILPAPAGTLFRSRAAVAAWLELHAGALAEALRYVEDRVEARVHAERAVAPALPGAPAAAPLTEVLRALRREAVALLVLRDEEREAAPATAPPGAPEADVGEAAAEPAARAAFLVERAHWGVFAGAVAREQDARPDLRLALTGPWPPYDFVRLELGA
ncbi:hypothetical protein tb265_01620 [Gemmatimonadetes bacterium T265]|nr:hypothetical protein tb265_01620 [Gemmatimonadetes bacterium T265]